MSALREIHRHDNRAAIVALPDGLGNHLSDNGWTQLSIQVDGYGVPHQATWYRWRRDIRHELHLILDGAGRVDTWSHWESRRERIDDDPGRRGRLEQFAADWGRTP